MKSNAEPQNQQIIDEVNTINKIIIHSIDKQINVKSIIRYSKFLFDVKDTKLISLINELQNNFYREVKHGKFVKDNKTDFIKNFESYIQNKDFDLLNFSTSVMESLKSVMDKQNFAKGGYIVFCESSKYLDIYVVRDKTGKKLSYAKDTFIIDDIIYIETTNLAMACRISKSEYERNTDRYLSFISNQKEDVSQYFLKWIGTEADCENSLDLKYLRKIINGIDLPQSDGKEIFSRCEMEDIVINICLKNYSKNVNLVTLGKEIWDDETILTEYARDHNIPINTIFTVSQKELRNFSKISLNKDGIILRFDLSMYQNYIYIDDNSIPPKIVIESENLVNQLKEALNG